MLEESNFVFRYVMQCDLDIPKEKMAQLFANSGDPEQMTWSGSAQLASDFFRGLLD